MTMNDANIKCLLHCSENILQCDVKHVSDFRDITLFFKILNNKPIELDIENLLINLSNIFSFDIEDVLNLDDKNFLTDFELLKILLLCIVVYILTNNDKGGSKKLNNLCDNIPIDLHKNACMMFAPLIVKFSDKIEITNKDLENALLLNDKENQTNFFSPIRDKHRPYLVNEKNISVHKQKIYRDMKASQSFEPFPLEMCTPPETSSPLVKLVEYVQSPNCQEKIDLRKTNKNLEKNVNQLEHQLFMNSNFENELDKTIVVWKQKCKNLEKEVKSMQTFIDEKDDIIREKSKEIDELKKVACQNKKLEDKSKDYQEKINEIQILNAQLDEKCEEIRNLKFENRESSHFKALAIDRRTVIKSLTGQIEQYKLMETQFHETCSLLMKTQSELNELQNQIRSSQMNKNSDSFSEVSFNSSIYNPESLAGIVEMERDELKTELSLLKESSVTKQSYENAMEKISELTRALNDSNVQCSQLRLEHESIATFCQSMNNCANQSSDLDSSKCLNDSIQEIFRQIQTTVTNQKENIEHLITANSILTNDINHKVDIEKKLILEIDSKTKHFENIELELREIKELLLPDKTFDIKDKEFFLEMKYKIISYQQTTENLKNHTLNNYRILRNEIATVKQIFVNIIQSLSVDFQNFQFLILSDSPSKHSFSNPFIESLHGLYNTLKENQANQDQLYSDTQELIKSLEKSQIKSEKRIKEHERMQAELTVKHKNEQLEMKTELSKLIFEYQECLVNLEDISSKYQEQTELKNENENIEKRISELTMQIDKINEELSTSESKLLSKTQEIKLINMNYSKEIENLKSWNATYKLKSEKNDAEKHEKIKNLETKIDTKQREIIEKEDKIKKLEEKNKIIYEELKLKENLEEIIKQKDKEINIKCMELEIVVEEKIKLENDLIRTKNEIVILGDLISERHEEIKNLEIKIDTNQREINGKEDKIKKIEEKNKIINEELILKENLEEMIKQKDKEINIKCMELQIENEEKIKLENDLIRSKNEIELLGELNSEKHEEIKNLEIIINRKQTEIIEEEDKIKKLEEKNKIIYEELKLKENLEEIIKQKDKEINIKCMELEIVVEEKIKLENDLIRTKNEIVILGDLISERHEEIKNLEIKIDTNQREINGKEDKIKKIEEKNKIINEELILKENLEEMIKQKDKEINIKCMELQIENEEKIKLENDLIRSKNEIELLGELNSEKHEEIKNLEIIINRKQTEIIEEEDKIKILEEKNKIIYEELILKGNLEEMIKQKDKEINIKCMELQIENEEKIKLENDLIRSKNEIVILGENNSVKIIELIDFHEKQQIESKGYLTKQVEEISNLKLLIEEKEQEISKNNDTIIQLGKQLEEMTTKHHDVSVSVDYLKIIDDKYVELSKIHQELEWRFEKSIKENLDSISGKNIEIDEMKTEINRFMKLEHEWNRDSEEKNARLSNLQQEVITTRSTIECLRQKHSKLDEENLLVKENFSKINNEHYLDIVEKNKNIDELNCRLLALDHSNRLLEDSAKDYSEKIALFEAAVTNKTKEIDIVNEKFAASLVDIEELKSRLKSQIDSEHSKENKIENLATKCELLQREKINLKGSIVDLNFEIAEIRKSNELKQMTIDNARKESEIEIDSLQKTVSNLGSQLEALQLELKSIAREKEAKSHELNTANMSLVDFHSKIQNLEAIISEEMQNYEKVTEEYKQAERESNCYREKYNNLMKLKRDESLSYESQLKKLTEHINKTEEEHDNQIHQMEKSFNSKIFDLQQNLDDKSSELDSIKSEIVESRKLSKSVRVNLESERDRLQKALTTRETQFSEEKAQLIVNLEKERHEKLKYKEHYEGVICKLENNMKIADELSKKEYDELNVEYNRLMEQLKGSQLGYARSVEELKQKELEYQKEKEVLINRLEELEPLENKIDELELTTERLLKKLNALEKSVSARELKNLRLEIITNKEAITIMEKEKKELISKLMSLENKVKNQIQHINEVTVGRNEYKNRLNNLQDQIYNFESLDKTRLLKIENIEREIESIKSENVSLKSRYLKLREISETHLEKVNLSHEETVSNYIDRIGSLTRDVANFQEQIQLLTAEKNMFKEDNNALKRSLSEVTSQFNNLKTVLQEHTANEVRTKYSENNRYTRMSYWDARPQMSRYLPPMNSLDTNSLSDLNLNPKSKLRFESYVFNPYSCEDESDISLVREFTQSVPGCEKKTIKSDGNLSQISSSTKKKKEGIRHQIATRIRRSLHLDGGGGSSELKFPEKNTHIEINPTSSSIKSESIASSVKVTSKPPALLRKKYAKSSQFNVIDLDEFRNRKEKIILKSPSKSKKFKHENVLSVSNTPTLNAVSSTSVNSLFDRNPGANEDLQENSPRQPYKIAEVGLRPSPYTQRPKTPKPNSIIRRLIRKSKTKTPISKCNSIEKMF